MTEIRVEIVPTNDLQQWYFLEVQGHTTPVQENYCSNCPCYNDTLAFRKGQSSIRASCRGAGSIFATEGDLTPPLAEKIETFTNCHFNPISARREKQYRLQLR